ncbi:HBS1-like protein [Phytophthora boehmeriae]|uniref:HBS1-like protein n=1 Tax=Phytophthora boehmeriae TaxID=109152 RepID=A0A8T1WIJ3_9STRA|nr:HBS1-like protein [Phytophthora boehmeriae]
MSRHRNVRNRAYSYEDEDYDEYYDDYEPNSPNNEFMYRRDSPSRQRSVFSFVQQGSENEQAESEVPSSEDAGDAELLDAMVPQVQQTLGNRFSVQQITQELRSANYDLDKTVVALLEKGKAPVAAGGVLPLQIQVPRLEAVALAIGKENGAEKEHGAKPKKEIVMPTPAKGKAAAIGTPLPSTPKAADEEKKVRISAADAATSAPTISRAQTQFTPSEKKAFERSERKTQEKAEKLEEEARSGGKTKVSMVVIGHVDAGKSTITGHLLYKLGYVSKKLMHKYEKESREAGKSSFAYAWVMDADEEERSRGVTMDVGTSYFETATKHVTLLDAPGHRDFIPKMIAGAAQADVAVLVVPAVTGEFEAAFENSGQTKEHTLLVRSLGVSQMVVAVNKMDMVGWDKERFDNIVTSLTSFLVNVGFRPKNLRFVPLSGMTGVNLEKTGASEECSWYSGPSLVEAIDTFAPPQRQISKPFRMTVSDVSKSMSLGQTISGRVYAGAAAVGDSFLLMPIGLPLTVKGMEQDGESCALARAGDTVDMGITGIDPSALTTGSILCSIASPVRLARKFEAKIMTMPAVEVPLVKGTYVTIHMHNVDEPVNITRLVSMLSKTGEVERKKPRCITRDRSAVVQITSQRSLCLEEFASYRQLGRFTLRDRGKTLAAGIITQIIA